MVRKNNDSNDNDAQQQQRQRQHDPPQRYGSAICDLIELNADGTRRSNSHLKISPASAFKKASVKQQHSSNSSSGLPLVFVDDDDDDDNDEQQGGEDYQHHDQEVIRAQLFKSHKGQQQQQQQQEADGVPVEATATTLATATTATAAAESSSVPHVHYTLEDADKRAQLYTYLQQESDEWKQLFPTTATTLYDAGGDSSLHDDFDVDVFMNATNDETLETPLHTACWKGPPQLALLMLETIPNKSHDDQQRKVALLKRDIYGNTPLHLACAHLNHNVDFTVIKNLLLLAPEALDQVNLSGDSPLHLLVGTSPGFARRSHIDNFSVEAAAEEAISSLLQMVGHLAMVQNTTAGWTLLHGAIAHGAHERVLVKLLSMAAPMGAASIPDNRGMLPLHFVAAFGGKHGGTPWTFVSQLIQAYEHGVVAQTENGDTALHLLLSNAAKRTAVEGSFLNRNTTKLAELLVMNSETTISPLLVKNKVDLTPLHCCALFDTPAQLTRLVMECSPVAEQASAVTPTFGATPVHLACASLHPDSANIEALATRLACCTRDDKDRTPLVVAVQNDKMHSQVIKHLIAVYPQAVDHATRKGHYLPLHLAVMNSGVKESVIRNLLKASPNTIQIVTKSGNTALHIACQQPHPNATIIKLLLDRYRDASRLRNKAGQLPIELVVNKKQYKSLMKKVPGLLPAGDTSGGGENLPIVKSSPSKTSSPSKPPSSSNSSSKKKSSSSSKKRAAIIAAAAAAAATTTADASKSSSSSTVHSSTDGSVDEDDDCDDNISDKVSCLTEPSHF